jgi:hypothetical protein
MALCALAICNGNLKPETETIMTQPSSLGTFVKTQTGGGDRYVAKDNVGKTLLVWVRERKDGIKTKHKDAASAVTCDLVELLDANNVATGHPYIGIMWFGDAVVDQLTPYVGQGPVPIKLQFQQSQSGGNAYIAPEAVSPELAQYAADWFQAYPTFLDDSKRKRAEEAKAAAVAAGLPQAPAAAQPTLGQGLAGPAPVPAAAAPVAAAPVAAAPPAAPVAAVPAAVFQPAAPAVPAAAPAAPVAPVAAPAVPPVVTAPAPVAAPVVPAPVVAPAAPAVAAPVPPAPVAPGVTDASVDALLAEVNAM